MSMESNFFSQLIKINDQKIGEGQPVYVVAEISTNHMQSLDKSIDLLHKASAAGANAVKVQTFTANTITLNSTKPDFLLKESSPWKKYKTLYNLFDKASMPWEHQSILFKEASRIGITLFSSPFDETAVDFLEDLGCPAYKIASPEITDVNLIRRCGQTGKPVIISTGVAEIEDINLALKTLKEVGCKNVILLKCTASYPAPIENLNLKTIVDMKSKFNCLVGLSDHTIDPVIPALTVGLGASLIEKHFILDKDDESMDAFFSLDPKEFSEMVKYVRLAEASLGNITYELDDDVKVDLRGRRSLYVAQDIAKGELFSRENIRSVRPAFGMHPKHLNLLIGKRSKQKLIAGDRLNAEDVDWD